MGGMSFLVHAVGFFNDSYDLFVMSIVNVILESQYGGDVYTKTMASTVSAAVFAGSVIGQLLFGYYADRLGRRKIMISTVALLIFGGLLCTTAYAPTPTGLFYCIAFYRFILGVGIGGEYPLSSTATAENSNTEGRGRAVSSTFSMQGVGQLVAAILANLLIQCLANSHDKEYEPARLETIWRILFGFGTIPAILILYPRFKAEESVHFRKANGGETGQDSFMSPTTKLAAEKHIDIHTDLPSLRMRIAFILRHYGGRLFGCAGTWFLFDIVFYSQAIFAASVLKTIGVKDDSPPLNVVSLQYVFLALGALPGYLVAILLIDRMGRKTMQLQGFVVMTILFTVLGAFWNDIVTQPIVFLVLYGLTFFFMNFGPNTTTFILPVESFPTPLRATCHGFSAAAGKVGAFIGAYSFEHLKVAFGPGAVFLICAAICAISVPITYWFVEDRTGDLAILDVELQKFLESENFETRHRLSIAFEKSMDAQGITPQHLSKGLLSPIELKSPRNQP